MQYPKEGFRNFYDDVSIDAVVQDSFMGLEEFQLLVPSVFGSETIFLDQLNFSGTLSEYAVDSIRLNYREK